MTTWPPTCHICKAEMKQYLSRNGPTGFYGCEHCDRGCPKGVSGCKHCARLK